MTQDLNVMRPALTPEEIAMLTGHAQRTAVARAVLDDLEAIGVPVAEHRALLDQTEQIRTGLLDRFSSTTPVLPPTRRARRG